MSGASQPATAALGVAAIEECLQAMRSGRMVILVDDEDRENEGDLVVAAEKVSPDDIAFMARQGRGLICLALDGADVERLGLEPMARTNQAPLGTAFTQSIDAVDVAGSGVSARARAHTIRRAVDGSSGPADFRIPGHVFPLRARSGGVLVRSGQTEGSVDLARLAGLRPAAVICEVMAPDGTMMRLAELLEFGARHSIPVATVADLIEHRVRAEPLIVVEATSHLPTAYGDFTLAVFRSTADSTLHAALTMGTIERTRPTLVRVQRSNPLDDVFRLRGKGGTPRLDRALEAIAREGAGALVYLSVRSDPAALVAATSALGQGLTEPRIRGRRDRHEDFKEFGLGAQILRHLGLGRLRVLTDQPRRLRALSGFGLEIVEWVSFTDCQVDTGTEPGP
jgi:3,4-dihydroxy 2-butanone 4-phosphate synthase/GTP cyclohydrolase II